MRDHVHQWQLLTTDSSGLYAKKAYFVCECGASKEQRLKWID